MALYHECEYCGATLDPYEHCDCPESRAERTAAGFQLTEKHTADGTTYEIRLTPKHVTKAKK